MMSVSIGVDFVGLDQDCGLQLGIFRGFYVCLLLNDRIHELNGCTQLSLHDRQLVLLHMSSSGNYYAIIEHNPGILPPLLANKY